FYDAQMNSAITGASGAYNTNGSLKAVSPNPAACSPTDHTVCTSAIKYAGTITQEVFTPNCYVFGSSLEHLEDECLSPSNNNGYFLIANYTPPGIANRSFTPEERKLLGDLGYEVNTLFGTTNANNVVDYASTYGHSTISRIPVVGVNDGIKDGFFQYVTD